jgi:valyl-tRNA synthetase
MFVREWTQGFFVVYRWEDRMPLEKRYQPHQIEPALRDRWLEQGPLYSIDTPPPTVSGHLHLGHVYSYSHPDFMARYFRMRGRNVFYPMGFDDNGLPTERLVEKRLGSAPLRSGGRHSSKSACRSAKKAEQDYRALWQRLGLSIDWRYTYRTIDDRSRRTRRCLLSTCIKRAGVPQARPDHLVPGMPHGHCPGRTGRPAAHQRICHPALHRGKMVRSCLIATTRPELLAACVAVFVHPEDERYRPLVGQQVTVPLYEQQVPLLADPV